MALPARITFTLLAAAAALIFTAGGLAPTASAEPPQDRAWQLAIRETPPPVIEVPTLPVAPVVAPVDWSIGIQAYGWQDELDQCLWVRMDFDGVAAPLVGAHNFCGGSFILDLVPGQIIELSGFELDGRYVVTEDRQVFSGDDAIAATSGLVADVILQTCYWDAADGMRLVSLIRQ